MYSHKLTKEELELHVAQSLLASAKKVKLYSEVHFHPDGTSKTVFVVYYNRTPGNPFKNYLEAIKQYNLMVHEQSIKDARYDRWLQQIDRY